MALGYANMSAAFLGRAEVARQRLSQMRRAVNQNNQWEIAFTEMWTAVFYDLMREYAQAAPFAAARAGPVGAVPIDTSTPSIRELFWARHELSSAKRPMALH